MPRQAKKGLDFFPTDCGIFSAKSDLKPLMRRFGNDGFALYMHILCDVYSSGYYFRPEDYEDYLYELSDDLNISVDKVKLVIAFMKDRTLLDAFSLDKNTVFTSHGIQIRYVEAMKSRKRKVAEIKGEHWLLTSEEEAKLDTFYNSTKNANNSGNIPDNSGNIPDNSENNTTKEIKGNERKLNESIEEESKKVSNKKSLQSYDEIFEEFNVGDREKEAYLNFIRHLLVNHIVLINDRLQNIIIQLDMLFGNDEQAKVVYINDAISKGYKRLPCEVDEVKTQALSDIQKPICDKHIASSKKGSILKKWEATLTKYSNEDSE